MLSLRHSPLSDTNQKQLAFGRPIGTKLPLSVCPASGPSALLQVLMESGSDMSFTSERTASGTHDAEAAPRDHGVVGSRASTADYKFVPMEGNSRLS